MQVHKN